MYEPIEHREFNGFNQLTRFSDEANATTYEYDALHRRSAKINQHGRVDFLWDGPYLIGEVRDGLFTWWIYEPGTFRPLLMIQNGKVYYYHTDHLGTPLKLTDENAEVVWMATYSAFGKATILVEKVKQPLRFPGQYYDEESGLCSNGFRYYDPELGRYITQDPIGLAGGLNPYQYAPNPVMWIDPTGLICKEGLKKQLTEQFQWLGAADVDSFIADLLSEQGIPYARVAGQTRINAVAKSNIGVDDQLSNINDQLMIIATTASGATTEVPLKDLVRHWALQNSPTKTAFVEKNAFGYKVTFSDGRPTVLTDSKDLNDLSGYRSIYSDTKRTSAQKILVDLGIPYYSEPQTARQENVNAMSNLAGELENYRQGINNNSDPANDVVAALLTQANAVKNNLNIDPAEYGGGIAILSQIGINPGEIIGKYEASGRAGLITFIDTNITGNVESIVSAAKRMRTAVDNPNIEDSQTAALLDAPSEIFQQLRTVHAHLERNAVITAPILRITGPTGPSIQYLSDTRNAIDRFLQNFSAEEQEKFKNSEGYKQLEEIRERTFEMQQYAESKYGENFDVLTKKQQNIILRKHGFDGGLGFTGAASVYIAKGGEALNQFIQDIGPENTEIVASAIDVGGALMGPIKFGFNIFVIKPLADETQIPVGNFIADQGFELKKFDPELQQQVTDLAQNISRLFFALFKVKGSEIVDAVKDFAGDSVGIITGGGKGNKGNNSSRGNDNDKKKDDPKKVSPVIEVKRKLAGYIEPAEITLGIKGDKDYGNGPGGGATLEWDKNMVGIFSDYSLKTKFDGMLSANAIENGITLYVKPNSNYEFGEERDVTLRLSLKPKTGFVIGRPEKSGILLSELNLEKIIGKDKLEKFRKTSIDHSLRLKDSDFELLTRVVGFSTLKDYLAWRPEKPRRIEDFIELARQVPNIEKRVKAGGPLTSKSLVLDTNVLSAAQRLLNGDNFSDLQQGEKIFINSIRRYLGIAEIERTSTKVWKNLDELFGNDIDVRTPDIAIAELLRGKKGNKPEHSILDQISRIRVNLDRNSQKFSDSIHRVEVAKLGKDKGAIDRAIIIDSFYADREPNSVPRIFTGDKDFYKNLAKFSIPPTVFGEKENKMKRLQVDFPDYVYRAEIDNNRMTVIFPGP